MSESSTRGNRYPGRRVWHLKRRKFVRAYRVLREIAETHKEAGHDVEFTAVNEAHVLLMCHGCPDLATRPNLTTHDLPETSED